MAVHERHPRSLAEPTDILAAPRPVPAGMMGPVEAPAGPSPLPPGFRALSVEERHYLHRWAEAARSFGVDALEDLTGRPWPRTGADLIIGVFRAGDAFAAWLVVRHDGLWSVASTADQAVADAVESLAEALAIVCPVSVPHDRVH